MGGKHFVLREGFLYTGSGAETYAGDGLVEAAKLAQVLQVVIHLLIAHHGQCVVANGLQILVFIEDGLGVFVQVDGQAVVGLPSTTDEI